LVKNVDVLGFFWAFIRTFKPQGSTDSLQVLIDWY